MSLKSLFRKVAKAAPIIIANAPVLIGLFKEVKEAVKKPKAEA